MSRERGIEMVSKYDHVKPSDLYEWLEYVDRDEEWFTKIADTFRSPRVWAKNISGNWIKTNLWD